jgi:hypothetical protein
MIPHRQVATFVVETLAMKLAPLDEDGLDVVFTIGAGKYDMQKVKGTKGPESIRRKMMEAWPQTGHEYSTDMSHTLSKLYTRFYVAQNKPMTLIVITDGIWEGTRPENKVETSLVEFVKNLPYSPVERLLTIQFVRLGNNEAAIQRLIRLDDELKDIYKDINFR